MFVKKLIWKNTMQIGADVFFFDNAPKKVNWKQAVKSRFATL